MELRNMLKKSECRRAKSESNPKSEIRRGAPWRQLRHPASFLSHHSSLIRHSSFGFLSSFCHSSFSQGLGSLRNHVTMPAPGGDKVRAELLAEIGRAHV